MAGDPLFGKGDPDAKAVAIINGKRVWTDNAGYLIESMPKPAKPAASKPDKQSDDQAEGSPEARPSQKRRATARTSPTGETNSLVPAPAASSSLLETLNPVTAIQRIGEKAAERAQQFSRNALRAERTPKEAP